MYIFIHLHINIYLKLQNYMYIYIYLCNCIIYTCIIIYIFLIYSHTCKIHTLVWCISLIFKTVIICVESVAFHRGQYQYYIS